jgi:hypothetical protein
MTSLTPIRSHLEEGGTCWLPRPTMQMSLREVMQSLDSYIRGLGPTRADMELLYDNLKRNLQERGITDPQPPRAPNRSEQSERTYSPM